MLNNGIPPIFIRWIRSFLADRRACAQLFNVFSSSRRFAQGLPLGSILAPLLFLFHINDLASTLNDNAVIAPFVDDVSILTTARKREDAKAVVSLPSPHTRLITSFTPMGPLVEGQETGVQPHPSPENLPFSLM